MLYFVNRTTGWWSAPYLTISDYASKETSVDALSTSLFLHNSIPLLYRESMSHYHIILASWFHINNLYCNSSALHLCTTLCKLDSDSNNLCGPLKYDSTVNYDPHKYFMNFPTAHLTSDASPTKLCLDFSSGKTVDLEMKDIGRRWILYIELSNSHFLTSFYCASSFIASSVTSSCRSTFHIPYLDQYILM